MLTDYQQWPDGFLTWCEECGREEGLRACPTCDMELCPHCGTKHHCDELDAALRDREGGGGVRRITHRAGGETYPAGDGVCPHGSLVCESCAYDSGLRAALEAVMQEREFAISEDGTPQPRHFGLVTAYVAIERLIEAGEERGGEQTKGAMK